MFDAIVDVYSHGVNFSALSEPVRKVLRDYTLKNLTEFRTEYDRFKGTTYQVIDKFYIGVTQDKVNVSFHAHLFDDIMEYLRLRDINMDRLLVRKHVINPDNLPKVVFENVSGKEPRDYQEELIIYVDSDGHTKVITLQTGTGKAQPLYSKILTPAGWKKMGDVVIGDDVTAWDGTPTKVTGVYPQGKKTIYRVTFADGRSTECCGEHLWKVFNAKGPVADRWKVIDTIKLKSMTEEAQPRAYVPLAKPQPGRKMHLPIDPYTLGILIGDGHFGRGLLLATPDQYILDRITSVLPEGMLITHRGDYNYAIIDTERGNRYSSAISSLQLRGTLSHTKFIPEIYMNCSLEQRLELIRGLMDSDGFVDKGGNLQYSTTSERLAEQVVELIRSVGGIAKVSIKQPSYTYKGVKKPGKPAYTICIRHTKPSDLVSLPRKKDRCNDDNQYSSKLKLRVVSVEEIGTHEAQCISIEHRDHLYVTDDYVVTHNTYTSLMAARKLGGRLCLMMQAKYIDKWVGDVIEVYGKKCKLVKISGGKELRAFCENYQVGGEDFDVVLVSVNTFMNYIKLYERADELFDYPYPPIEFYERHGIKTRILDEAHQSIHQNTTIDIYTHVFKAIYLTATLRADDTFKNKMYEIAYPTSMRLNTAPINKYINVTALMYGLKNPDKIKYKRRKQYNHVLFEENLMKQAKMRDGYYDMIASVVKEDYLKERKPGQKMLIFAATILMCTQLVDYLKREFPGLDIQRYVSGDDYDKFVAADLGVSTIGSAGTAVDIPGLKKTLMTTAISSRQSNEQAVGRLRVLKDGSGDEVEFLYLVCEDIPKHMDYHRHKQEIFRPLVKSQRTVRLGVRI